MSLIAFPIRKELQSELQSSLFSALISAKANFKNFEKIFANCCASLGFLLPPILVRKYAATPVLSRLSHFFSPEQGSLVVCNKGLRVTNGVFFFFIGSSKGVTRFSLTVLVRIERQALLLFVLRKGFKRPILNYSLAITVCSQVFNYLSEILLHFASMWIFFRVRRELLRVIRFITGFGEIFPGLKYFSGF